MILKWQRAQFNGAIVNRILITYSVNQIHTALSMKVYLEKIKRREGSNHKQFKPDTMHPITTANYHIWIKIFNMKMADGMITTLAEIV